MHANFDQLITKGAQPTRENKSIIKKVKSGTYRLEALYMLRYCNKIFYVILALVAMTIFFCSVGYCDVLLWDCV
jgi:alkyl hydroperoxide reductase subunit AhpF